MSAPVLPAETTQSASPSATARMARPKLDSLPCRNAWAGGRSDLMTSSAWRSSLRSSRKGRAFSKGRSCSCLPKKRKRHSGLRSAARCAPSTTISGALSPPMASNAKRGERTEEAFRLEPLLFDIACPSLRNPGQEQPRANDTLHTRRTGGAGDKARRNSDIRANALRSTRRAHDACRDACARPYAWELP